MVQFDLFGELETKLTARQAEKAARAAEQASAPRRGQPPKGMPTRSAGAPRRLLENSKRRIHDLATNIASTWHRNFGGSSIEIPIGVVASLMLFKEPVEDELALAQWVLQRKRHELPKLYQEVWAMQWIARPDLITRALPLHRWLDDEEHDTQRLHAVQAVTATALEGGLTAITGRSDPYDRAETDVLGPLIMELRSKSSRKGTASSTRHPRSQT
ncbi:hypothetical protein [Streptomyces luteireticuli]|uniref:hypothetical protein n=1 Tax=Streptomyces luteireticuli TaxID=173858 RepID=UPI0035567D58